jgi:hypothetical protein
MVRLHGRPVPVALFLEQLTTWASAFEQGRLGDARRAAEELAVVGTLLSADPEFRAHFHRAREPSDPDDASAALTGLCAMLRAVTKTAVPGTYRSGPV